MTRPASTTQSLNVENIPAELKARRQWVVWRYERRGDPWTKAPYNARTGERASVTNPRTWSTFEHTLETAQKKGFDGIGFVFSPKDPYCGIDLDDCMRDDGKPVAEAQAILDRLDGYAEVSPSGRGVKVWVKAELPGTGWRSKTPAEFKEIEIYDRGRFFALTGWTI